MSKQVSAIERILLTTDGTVTPMLEHLTGERIAVTKVVQRSEPADDEVRALLRSSAGRELLVRTSELAGTRTGTVYLRAVTVAARDALPDAFWSGLVDGREPIGRLLRRQRIETFREILEHEVRAADSATEGYRRYLVFVAGSPALLISETFLFDRLPDRTSFAQESRVRQI